MKPFMGNIREKEFFKNCQFFCHPSFTTTCSTFVVCFKHFKIESIYIQPFKSIIEENKLFLHGEHQMEEGKSKTRVKRMKYILESLLTFINIWSFKSCI